MKKMKFFLNLPGSTTPDF